MLSKRFRYYGNNFKNVPLEVALTTVTFTVAVIVLFGSLHGLENYEQIKKENILLYLQQNEHRDMKILNQNLSDCKYDYLSSDVMINKHDFVYDNHDFDVENGTYFPRDCKPMYSTAVLVTYRNREPQLAIFLKHIHTFLKTQNIHYKIYVIEQCDDAPWNKGALYNIGAMRAIEDGFHCLILHDVDLLPLSTSNIYACTTFPRHMSSCIDKFRFILPYEELAGGVVSISCEQFVQANGLSNRFLNWGGEDDDFYKRLISQDLKMIRFPNIMSHYTMLRHKQENRNPERKTIIKISAGHYLEDGFQSVRWSKLEVTNKRLYEHICVQVTTS